MPGELLNRGREAYASRAWADAYDQLSRAGDGGELGADDLELLATSAYMLGRDTEHLALLERAYRAHLDVSEPIRGARCAFWVGVFLVTRGQMGPGSGWLGRAERLIDGAEEDCAERGYLLLPLVLQRAASGEFESAAESAAAAVEIGERFSDPDLIALAVQEQGNALIKQDRVEEGLALLDEAMVSVVAGELSPIPTGLVYCGVIDFCHEVFALNRAQQWTDALTQWCADQPDMVSFTGRCLVHRAEIMQLRGNWSEALEEARRAGDRLSEDASETAAAQAFYRQGELHRLMGEADAADAAYREVAEHGGEPQPGLALLRLGLGDRKAASAAIRRALAETTDPLSRARLLPAFAEIMVALGDVEAAREASAELERISATNPSSLLGATAAMTRGVVVLASGDPAGALATLRQASHEWQTLDAPYEQARARRLIALACRQLQDDEAAELELDAARSAFERLGAAVDLAGIEANDGATTLGGSHGLSDRELEVLRLVAAGKTNRQIAAALVISEHTVARHLQNIFAKLGVSSRTAASAFAFEHRLL